MSIPSSIPCPTTTGGTIGPPSVRPNATSLIPGDNSEVTVTSDLQKQKHRPTTGTDLPVSTVTGAAMVVTSLVQVTPSIATFTPVRILTGTCTSPRIAYATDLAGQLMQFPWIGCSHEDSGCCPFDVGEERFLTACPVDYTTTSSACCPS